MLNSDYKFLGKVKFPEYKGRQKYMHSFDIKNPVMHDGYEDYLDIVCNLLEAAKVTDGEAHMTVDEKIVKSGWSQRRPRPHVDGCYMKGQSSWAHPEPKQGWHHPNPCKPFKPHWSHYIAANNYQRMSVIVASDVGGCRAWRGKFTGEPKSDGDLSHIYNQLGKGEIIPENIGALLSPDCVHESMIFEEDTRRMFLRIALPVECIPTLGF